MIVAFRFAIIRPHDTEVCDLDHAGTSYLHLWARTVRRSSRAAATAGEAWKSQGRVLSSMFLGDWQLFLPSSSFSCRWGCTCNESSQFTSGPNERGMG